MYRVTLKNGRTIESDTWLGFRKLIEAFCDEEHRPGIECRVCGKNENGWIATHAIPTEMGRALVEGARVMMDEQIRLYKNPKFHRFYVSQKLMADFTSLCAFREVGEGSEYMKSPNLHGVLLTFDLRPNPREIVLEYSLPDLPGGHSFARELLPEFP